MQDSRTQVFSQRGTVFETMPGASTSNPHIFKLRMAVNQEIAVPSIFVLAYACFNHRSVLEFRYVLPQIFSQLSDGGFLYYSHTCVRVKALSMTVKCNFEPASLDIRQRVRQSGMRAMQPHWHLGWPEIQATRRSAKKKYFLSGGKYSIAEQFSKNLWQPWTAAKNKCSCRN